MKEDEFLKVNENDIDEKLKEWKISIGENVSLEDKIIVFESVKKIKEKRVSWEEIMKSNHANKNGNSFEEIKAENEAHKNDLQQ